jgi:hypothetical protein
LKTRGIITQNGSINPRFKTLFDFLGEYQKFFLRKLAAAISRDAVILWQKNEEFLMQAPVTVQRVPKDFLKTGTSVFQEYDLPLFSESEIYLYSKDKKEIRPEDAILHTLLIEPNSTRYTTYALLLLKKTQKEVDKTYLIKEAERFELKNQVTGTFEFLETHKRPEGQPLPTWNEFVMKSKDYGIMAE